MGFLDLLKGAAQLVDFDNFRKEVNKKLDEHEKRLDEHDIIEHKLQIQKRIFDEKCVRKIIENQYYIIDMVFERIITKFKKLDFNERNFSVFLTIQQQNIDKYYGEDFEKQHLLLGSNMDLAELVQKSMREPVSFLKRVRVPELRKVFETYDERDRTEHITKIILTNCEDLKDMFFESFRNNREIVQMYS